MLSRLRQVSIVNRSRACIDGFQTPAQLAPIDVFGVEVESLQVACVHVLEEGLLRVAAFQLHEPEVVVCVDHAWGDELVGTVDNLGVFGRVDVLGYGGDFVALDEDVRGVQDRDFVVGLVFEDGASPE